MLISRVPENAYSVEFAARHASALIPSSTDGGFAAYLANVMDGARASDPPGIDFSSPAPSYDSPHMVAPYHLPSKEPMYDAPESREHGGGPSVKDPIDPPYATEHHPPAALEANSAGTTPDSVNDTDDTSASAAAGGESVANADDESARSDASEQPAGEKRLPKAEASDLEDLSTGAPERNAGEGAAKEALSRVTLVGRTKESVVLDVHLTEDGDSQSTVERRSDGKLRAAGVKSPSVNPISDNVVDPTRLSSGDASAKEGPSGELGPEAQAQGSASTDESQNAFDKRSGSLPAGEGRDAISDDAGSRSGPTANVMIGEAAHDVAPAASESKSESRRSTRSRRIEVQDLRPAERATQPDTVAESARNTGADAFGSNAETGTHDRGDAGVGRSENGIRIPDPMAGEAFLSDSGESTREGTLLRPHVAAGRELGRALRENLGAEIVRQARFVIRNNDSGTIRLNLRPEHLGSVRIALQMQEGHIAGRIIVDNESVREAFEQNLSALEQAFEESGLELGQLDVALADAGTHPGEDASASNRQSVSGNAVQTLADAVPTVTMIDEQHDLVDVLA